MIRLKDDQGIATVLIVSVLGGLLVLVGAVAIVVDFAHTKSQAATAGDLAALAGAREVLLGDPCTKAEEIARANRSQVVSCVLDGQDVQVEVKTSLHGAADSVFDAIRIGDQEVTAVSRAGPASCDQGLTSLGISC